MSPKKGGASHTTSVSSRKQSELNLALSVAGVCVSSSVTQRAREETVTLLAADIANESKTHLALLCLGELGKQTDLASSPSMQALSLESKIIACFESNSSDTQMAAAYALGSLALGNMEKYIPLILSPLAVPSQEKLHYLLLASLREILQVYANRQATQVVQELVLSSSSIGDKDKKENKKGNKKDNGVVKRLESVFIDQMAPVLLSFASSPQPQVRNSCAECAGLLAYLAPTQLLPPLRQLYQDNPPLHAEVKVNVGSASKSKSKSKDKEKEKEKEEKAKAKEGTSPLANSKETHARWTAATAVRFVFSRRLPSADTRTEEETAIVSTLIM